VTRRPGVYLTTPIYYASGEPHIGHAYTTFLGDTLARYHRQCGTSVLYLTGTDEHGQKIQEEAARREMEPRDLCDEMAARFARTWKELDIEYDRFIRTTEEEHVAVVRAFLVRLHDRGLIYEDSYRGWYCVHEERYWTEKDLTPEGNCPDCGRPVREIEEKNYFFRMSRFQEELISHIEANPDWIVPEVRRNEVLGFLQKPLEDLSISRPKSRVRWGIPLPFDEEHVAYVWVDALINYVTASGAIDPEAGASAAGFDDPSASWWPADLHLIGKDILTTHAVYWPTILMGVGLPLPRRLLAHGWWVSGKEKMSKSLGNVIDPISLSEEYGTDAVRWYLLREMPTGSDASYTPERFLARHEELANILGNLASRAISMILRYRDGVVPDGPADGLDEALGEAIESYHRAMAELRVHEALGTAMELARTANGFVETGEPWSLAKSPDRKEDLDRVLATLARTLGVLAALFFPVMPRKMEELADALGLQGVPTLPEASGLSPAGLILKRLPPLFPRRDRDAGNI
jgi:methionyl-tRNA synthetase